MRPRTGLLIGNQGANIKQLRRESGAKAPCAWPLLGAKAAQGPSRSQPLVRLKKTCAFAFSRPRLSCAAGSTGSSVALGPVLVPSMRPPESQVPTLRPTQCQRRNLVWRSSQPQSQANRLPCVYAPLRQSGRRRLQSSKCFRDTQRWSKVCCKERISYRMMQGHLCRSLNQV